jgi:hypothetical protein
MKEHLNSHRWQHWSHFSLFFLISEIMSVKFLSSQHICEKNRCCSNLVLHVNAAVSDTNECRDTRSNRSVHKHMAQNHAQRQGLLHCKCNLTWVSLVGYWGLLDESFGSHNVVESFRISWFLIRETYHKLLKSYLTLVSHWFNHIQLHQHGINAY